MPSDLVARDLAAFWHPCSQMRDYQAFPPLEIVGARGSRLRLGDGREILDAISSWWCKALGHGDPRLAAALRAQHEAFEHVIAANTTNEPLVRFCERILAAANGLPAAAWAAGAAPGRRPGHFGKVFLADNGSTAVEIALKMALQAQAQRGAPRRTRFAALENGYHGETVATLSVGDLALYAAPYQPLCFPVHRVVGLPYRRGPHDPAWMDTGDVWPEIERALDAEAETLAAVVYEPVLQAAGGMLFFSPDLLRRLRAWADARGVYLIADEIAAGMGRLGAMLACHLADGPGRVSTAALPDFAALSKGLTAGVLPLSAVLTTDAIYDLFDADYADRRAFLHSNTYTGHALGVAVANAVLDIFAADDVPGRVAALAPHLHAAVEEIAADRPYLRGTRACGLVAAVDIRQPDGRPYDPARRTGYAVYREAVRRGALLRPLGDTMYLFPPLTSSTAEIDEMVTILADSLDAVMSR
ncbi:MAG TPA: adenosylmethionine--8-amino-7-oxononanoate transaminase [Polyangia bacterium]|nr:adenosylmethionine--8-amino-7-oxononanoate transaminase [Polyangia bacterium]